MIGTRELCSHGIIICNPVPIHKFFVKRGCSLGMGLHWHENMNAVPLFLSFCHPYPFEMIFPLVYTKYVVSNEGDCVI